MHCAEAPVDLQHGHADHHRVLLFHPHDHDQRAVPGDGSSLEQRKAADQGEAGRELWQRPAEEDERERAQETGQQDAL